MTTQKPVVRTHSSLDSWRCYSSVGADNFSSVSISVLTSRTKKNTVSRLSRVIYASRMIPAPQTPEKAFWSDLKTSVYKQGFGMWVYCSGRWIRDMMKICGDPDLPMLKGKLDSVSAWSIAFNRSSPKRSSICFLQRKKKKIQCISSALIFLTHTAKVSHAWWSQAGLPWMIWVPLTALTFSIVQTSIVPPITIKGAIATSV